MSSSRLPTEFTHSDVTTTGPPTQEIYVVAYFSEQPNSFGVLPCTTDVSQAAQLLARKVYDNALESTGGAAPGSKFEWEDHVRKACQTTTYLSYRPRTVNGDDEKQSAARWAIDAETNSIKLATFTAWISVTKDKSNDNALCFWVSLPDELRDEVWQDAEVQSLLSKHFVEIARRSAVPSGSWAEWQLTAARRYDRDHPDTDLKWFAERVQYAGQCVLWKEGITDTRVKTRTRHGPPPIGLGALATADSHQLPDAE